MKKEDILRKIKGLFALAEDNKNDAESQSAMLQAQKLMAKYGVELAEVAKEQKKNNLVEYRVNEPKTIHWYESQLASIVADNFKVKIFTYGKGKYKSLFFYGYEEDCYMAREIFFMIYEALMFHSKEHVSEYYMTTGRYEKRTRDLTASVRDSYMIGFLSGLRDAFDSQREELVQEYGLIVLTPKEVSESFDIMSEGWEINTVKSRSISNLKSFQSGLERGKKQNTTKLGKIE